MVNVKCVKILEDALKKYGSVPNLHEALIKVGVRISQTALYNAEKGIIMSFKPEINVALAHLVYNGDGHKFLKALEKDYLPKGLKD